MEMEQAFELLGTYTAEQWGMVTARQAKDLGVDAVTLHRLTKARFLDVVRRGVYAASSAVTSPYRDEQAVWLALNPAVPGWERPEIDPDGGVVSHQSAARLHGIGELVNDKITLTVPKRRDVRDPDVWTKRASLADADVTVVDGLPVTTVLRTVCDLLEQHIDGSHIATIIREGVLTGRLQIDELVERIAPYARRYGTRPHDGEALLEHLLDQIGVAVEDLTVHRRGKVADAHLDVPALVNQLALLNHVREDKALTSGFDAAKANVRDAIAALSSMATNVGAYAGDPDVVFSFDQANALATVFDAARLQAHAARFQAQNAIAALTMANDVSATYAKDLKIAVARAQANALTLAGPHANDAGNDDDAES